MDKDEPLDKAAARELQEETSVNPKDVLLTQASIFSLLVNLCDMSYAMYALHWRFTTTEPC